VPLEQEEQLSTLRMAAEMRLTISLVARKLIVQGVSLAIGPKVFLITFKVIDVI
jgi:hypothetical protein